MQRERWYDPQKHTGWRKSQAPNTRRSKLMASTDRRMTMHNRHLQAGRRAQALANVTKDKETERKARSDAKHFYKLDK